MHKYLKMLMSNEEYDFLKGETVEIIYNSVDEVGNFLKNDVNIAAKDLVFLFDIASFSFKEYQLE